MRVAVIGLGGLGGPAARALAAAGVPTALFDGDRIEVHNLPRQTLFGDRDIGAPKASTAALRLRECFPSADIVANDVRIDAENLSRLDDCGLWIDATDQLASKLFFSDQAVACRRSLIHGGAVRFGGQALAIVPGVGPCLRCLVEDDAEGETCQTAGILGPVVALLGAEMARLTLQALRGEPVAGRYVAYDARRAELRSGTFPRRPGCPACGALFEQAPRQSERRNEEEKTMAHVKIPASLRSYTQNQEEVEVPGASIGEVIQNLESKYPGLRDRILDGQGVLRRYVNVFHNQEDVRFLQQLATAVKDGDRIAIVPAIAGG